MKLKPKTLIILLIAAIAAWFLFFKNKAAATPTIDPNKRAELEADLAQWKYTIRESEREKWAEHLLTIMQKDKKSLEMAVSAAALYQMQLQGKITDRERIAWLNQIGYFN
jgi:hypothetical protein